MDDQIQSSIQRLRAYTDRRTPDRDEVVAHATLSAFAHHWPSKCGAEILQLLADTDRIKREEPSRWKTQRRIAIAKLCGRFASRA
jgi:hypothetical protein